MRSFQVKQNETLDVQNNLLSWNKTRFPTSNKTISEFVPQEMKIPVKIYQQKILSLTNNNHFFSPLLTLDTLSSQWVSRLLLVLKVLVIVSSTLNPPKVVKWHLEFVKHGSRCWLKAQVSDSTSFAQRIDQRGWFDKAKWKNNVQLDPFDKAKWSQSSSKTNGLQILQLVTF
jgi:hypothetical protein